MRKVHVGAWRAARAGSLRAPMLLSRLTAPPRAALLLRPAKPSRVVLTRVRVVAAMLLFVLSATAIVFAGRTKLPLPQGDAQYINTRLVQFDQSVRAHLVRLGAPGSVHRARDETRSAIAALEALARPVNSAAGSDVLDLQTAMSSELRFLDAVGSALANPRSPKLAQLAALDAAARRAIAALDGPRARRMGGVSALQRLWKSSRAPTARAA